MGFVGFGYPFNSNEQANKKSKVEQERDELLVLCDDLLNLIHHSRGYNDQLDKAFNEALERGRELRLEGFKSSVVHEAIQAALEKSDGSLSDLVDTALMHFKSK